MIAPASRHLGKYEIRQKLGRGGMADVYLAQDTALGYTVALKLIEHSADSDTREAIAAERRGADLQAHLAAIDPRVVRIFDCNDVEGYFYVAMEYIDGQDLSDLVRRGPLAVPFAVDVAVAVAETLDHAHHLQGLIDGKECHGMVHGDIKPKNIRIDSHGKRAGARFRHRQGALALAQADAQRIRQRAVRLARAAGYGRRGFPVGPVVAGGDAVRDGDRSCSRTRQTSTELLERMIRSGVPAPPAPDPCPELLRRVLEKALAPERDLRYQSARELAADLRAFRQGAPLQAVAEDLEATRRTGRRAGEETRRTNGVGAAALASEATRRTAPAPPPANQPPRQFGTKRRGRRIPKWAQAAGALVFGFLLYGGGSSYMLYRHGQDLKHDIDTEQLTDPDAIWNRWTELSRGILRLCF